jgi:hypothetical protein
MKKRESQEPDGNVGLDFVAAVAAIQSPGTTGRFMVRKTPL